MAQIDILLARFSALPAPAQAQVVLALLLALALILAGLPARRPRAGWGGAAGLPGLRRAGSRAGAARA